MVKNENRTTGTMVMAYAKLLRMHHWVKSFLVLFPSNLFTGPSFVNAVGVQLKGVGGLHQQ